MRIVTVVAFLSFVSLTLPLSAQAPVLAAKLAQAFGLFVRDVAVNAAGNVVSEVALKKLQEWRAGSLAESSSSTASRAEPRATGWRASLSDLRQPPPYRKTYGYQFSLEWSDGTQVYNGRLELRLLTARQGATGDLVISAHQGTQAYQVLEIVNTAEVLPGQLVLQGSSPQTPSGRRLPAWRPDTLKIVPTSGDGWTISEICKSLDQCSSVLVTDAWTGLVDQ